MSERLDAARRLELTEPEKAGENVVGKYSGFAAPVDASGSGFENRRTEAK